MEMLNGLIETISVDFDSNNNSTPVDYSAKNVDYSPIEEPAPPTSDKDITKTVIELLNTFRAWKQSIEFIESEAGPQHDYKTIKANGFRSMKKVNTMAIKRVNKILSQKELNGKDLVKCIALARLLTKINLKTKEFHQRDLEYKQNLANNNEPKNDNNNQPEKGAKNRSQFNEEPFTSKNLFPSQVALDFFEFYNELEQDLIEYFRYHPLFYFRKGLRRSARLLLAFLSTSSSLPGSLFNGKKKKSKVIAKLLNSPTLTYPFSIIEQVNCSAYNDLIIPLKFIGDGLKTNTVYLPRQYKYLVNDLQTSMDPNDRFISIDNSWSYDQLRSNYKKSKADKIRVRIVREKATPKNGTVIFNTHGGAFVFHSPDCHEVYLREFAKSLPEVVIMSVDYRIRCEYPKGQQDVLDAYLWLTSGLDEVEEVLGFQPTKILLCGDSAGAFLNFSLVHLLKDFNVEIQNENLLDKTLRYPDAIFNLYGFYNLTTISPAIMLSNIDFFLPPTNMRIAFGSLLNGVEKPKFTKRIFFPYFVDKKKRWYDNSKMQEQTTEMIRHFETIPYLSSIHHFDYDAVKVPLYLVTSDLDICLDHNIDLANRWKGDVTLLVLEDVIHGFLQLEDGDRTIKEDILKSTNLLRIAVDKLSA